MWVEALVSLSVMAINFYLSDCTKIKIYIFLPWSYSQISYEKKIIQKRMILKIEVPDLGAHLKVMTKKRINRLWIDVERYKKSQLSGKVTLINHLNDIIY